MAEEEEQLFYDRIGLANGWDFSSVRSRIEGEERDVYEESAKRCGRSALWLDIGTGGGERILPHAEEALLLVGIDRSESMVRTAVDNGRKLAKPNVRFLRMDARRLDFPDGFFDLVTCRHSAFDANEAARVLRPGGYFLTQQVGERDKWLLKQAFGRGQHLDTQAGALLQKYKEELSAAAFRELEILEWDTVEYYESVDDLSFLLAHTPIIPDYGQMEGDAACLARFVAEHSTPQGIRTNAQRFMLIARK
ncbi:class I SAM-dependent methyltransferase [Paenibacillus rigui]|uniref:SAM-dependent methyltransferase n=1 Tax=Paenibacillus rigui TaxID=554312 RepID=A0A229UIB5_9BACL|nr:class I SAM-dependent methyltransferase [Paenibacillus rigui]OXM83187.1 SAM-dependent methyltransferase [Paenibacillus rigui]